MIGNASASDWEPRLLAWAKVRSDIKALIEIGSRAQAGTRVDSSSDYDYQLVTTEPQLYRDGTFAREIAPIWAVGRVDPTVGGGNKICAVFAGGVVIVDFVIVRHWEVRVATWAAHSSMAERFWPRRLRKGVDGLRLAIGPGFRVLKGGKSWESRYCGMVPKPQMLSVVECADLSDTAWIALVWATRKVVKGQYRAAEGAIHRIIAPNLLRLLYEEAVRGGAPARIDGAGAENWLAGNRLAESDVSVRPDGKVLADALLKYGALLKDVEKAILASKAPDREGLFGMIRSRLPRFP